MAEECRCIVHRTLRLPWAYLARLPCPVALSVGQCNEIEAITYLDSALAIPNHDY